MVAMQVPMTTTQTSYCMQQAAVILEHVDGLMLHIHGYY